jgi:hypothetical protein
VVERRKVGRNRESVGKKKKGELGVGGDEGVQGEGRGRGKRGRWAEKDGREEADRTG